MESTCKISKLLAENGALSGGFSIMTPDQLLRLKGGFRIPKTRSNIFNCGNCGCINIRC